MKYKYNVIVKGVEEPYTGIFGSKEVADSWFEVYGKAHVKRGLNLILKKVGETNRELIRMKKYK